MELKEATDRLFELLNVKYSKDVGAALIEHMENDSDFIERYRSVFGYEQDYMQMFYEYYCSERKEKKQDYTPPCLAKLLAELAPENTKTVYDICAGSGSLTLAIHERFPDAFFVLHELDSTVMPFLLFQLRLHDINAVVIQGDVFSDKPENIYRVKDKIEPLCDYIIGEYDYCVSNPPFNLKKKQHSIKYSELTYKDMNMNDAFLAYAKQHGRKASVILFRYENTKLTDALLNDKVIERVIMNPEKMFTNTPTGTSVIVMGKKGSSEDITLQDARDYYTKTIRDQNGQYGGNSHTGRTYHKEFYIYNDEQIENIAHKWRGPDTYEFWETDWIGTTPSDILTNKKPFPCLVYGVSDDVTRNRQEQEDKKRQLERERLQKQWDFVMSHPAWKIMKAIHELDIVKENNNDER